jgi:hypothetical protein
LGNLNHQGLTTSSILMGPEPNEYIQNAGLWQTLSK